MDIGLAIDALYSAGWCPADADDCIRAADGRWYPGEAAANAAFVRKGWTVRYDHTPGSSVRVTWSAQDGLHGAAIAPDPVSARILVFTALHRSEALAGAPGGGGIG